MKWSSRRAAYNDCDGSNEQHASRDENRNNTKGEGMRSRGGGHSKRGIETLWHGGNEKWLRKREREKVKENDIDIFRTI